MRQVGSVRPPAQGPKGGPIFSMAWHPYQPLLAAAGKDKDLSIYIIDGTA